MDPASRPAPHRYLLGLGSNQPHHRHGGPRGVLAAAVLELARIGQVQARSGVVTSAPLGPSRRRYANAVVVLESDLVPPAILAGCKRIERDFGRRGGGQRWGSRVLDLDLLLWSGGRHTGADLVIPHRAMRERRFVLGPAVKVAGDWRDPVTGLTLRQLHARLTRPRPLPKAPRVVGPVAQ